MILVKEHALKFRALFDGSHLRARSLRATVLTFVSFGGSKVMQLGANLILTRILYPEAFGLMALVSVFITGLQLMSDVGIKASLVRSTRAEDPVFQATSWTLQIVRGGWVTLLALIFAWPYAWLYDQPMLAPLILVMAFAPLIGGFGSIQRAIMERRLSLGRLVTLQLAGQVANAVVMVGFAVAFQSVWGLAWGNLAGAIVVVVLSHLILPSPNHRFMWDRSVLTEIVTFGRWVLVATLFTFLGQRGIQGVRGYLTDLETLAFLHIAMMFGWLIGELVQAVLKGVAYPVLSEVVRARPRKLQATAAKIRTLQTMFSTPGFIAIAAIAQPMIALLYDDRYLSAGPYLTMMSLANAIAVLPLIYQKTLLALGDSRVHAFVTGTSSALRIGGAIVGFYIGGVVGMLLADAVALLLVFAFSASIAVRRGYATLKVDVLNLAAIALAYAVLVPPLF